MISYTTGNILESNTHAIVNTVNCEGYMGKGIAYQFKLKYPKNNDVYIKACRNETFKIGDILIVEENQKMILNFPTKDKWREKSQYVYIEQGIDKLSQIINYASIKSIAIPPLGCGNGGLEWEKVKNIIINGLSYISDKCEIVIYEPTDNLAFVRNSIKVAPKLNTSHLLLILIKLNLKKFNKVRLQKAAFLINFFSGQDYFKFEAHNFGPYAHSIDILSRDIKEYQDFYGLTTEDSFKQALQVLISSKTENKLNSFSNSLSKAISFINEINDDKNLELLTTILFIVQSSKEELSLRDIVSAVHGWNEHKRISFSQSKIEESLNLLLRHGFINETLYQNYELRV